MTCLLCAAATVGAAPKPAHAASALPAAAGSAAAPAQDSQIQTLIDAIRNDKTRAKLIEALEKANAASAPAAASAPGEGVASFGRRIAESTQAAAEDAVRSVERFADQLMAAPRRLSALGPDQIDLFATAVRDVVLSIIATYFIYFVLRRLAVRLYRRVGTHARKSGFLRKVFLIVFSVVVDAAVVVAAWAAGYLVTLTVFGQFGSIGIRQSLYLNAFLMVELFRVLLRFVLSPSTADLRLINVSDRAAWLLNNRFTWIAVILGYGQLFVTPIFNQSISYAAGQALSILLALVALAIAVNMTVRHRNAVRAWLLGETTDRRSPSRFAQVLARYWYWLVLAYFVFLFVVIVTEPAANLLPILGATGEVIVALIIGLGITGWIGRINGHGIRLSESMTRRLPLLEARLNAFVPRILTIVRFLVAIGILAFVLNVAGAVDIGAWINTPLGGRVTAAVVAVAAILIVAFAVWIALTSWVDYRLNPDFGSVPSSREQTLLTLMRNAATIAIVVIALMFALSELGVNIAPLIASAGVFGLAIGFGAQKLVQDIITGIFIQLENAINVGDVVTAGGVTGTAERLTIRSLSIRDLDGTYHIIPFSSVAQVSNFMKGFSYAVCSIGVGYREDYEEVREAMFEAFEMLRSDPEHNAGIIGDMAWDGITQFADNAVVVRSRIKTTAGKQWGVGRAYNACIKKVFDARDIDIPVPQRTILFGRDKKGNAPPVHVRAAEEDKAEGIPPVIIAPPYGEDDDQPDKQEDREVKETGR